MEEKKHCKWYNEEMCTNDESPCVADYCPVVEYPELCKCREFDKDINVRSKDDTEIDVGMTDEEIVKSLECCINNECGEQCPYLGNKFDCIYNHRHERDCLDLIHRLQVEKAELKEDVERWEAVYKIGEERKYRKMFNEEWKKEYQKELDKQGEGLIAGSPDFDYVYQRYFEQKAEIERLRDMLSQYMNGEIVNEDIFVQQVEDIKQTEQRTAKEILLPLIGCEKQIDPLKTGIRWSVLKGFCKKFDIEVE